MIDFVKGYTIDKYIATKLRNTICTQVEVNHITGEMSMDKYFGIISEFEISVFSSGRIEFLGSFHKYYNNGLNNSDFTISQLILTINSFCNLIGINPEKTFIENLEFGVNISLPYPPYALLNNIVCLSCGKSFSQMVKALDGLNCKLMEYRHKIYNKTSKYNPNNWLLRYEIHVDKMRWVYPVKTLQDLQKIETWDFLQNRLIKQFQQIIFTDMYDINSFTKWEKNFFAKNKDKINNLRYWKELTPTERHRAYKWLRKIQIKGTYKFNELVAKKINEKVNELKNLQPFHHSNTG